MKRVKDFIWREGMLASELVERLGDVGFQGTGLRKASDIIAEEVEERLGRREKP